MRPYHGIRDEATIVKMMQGLDLSRIGWMDTRTQKILGHHSKTQERPDPSRFTWRGPAAPKTSTPPEPQPRSEDELIQDALDAGPTNKRLYLSGELDRTMYAILVRGLLDHPLSRCEITIDSCGGLLAAGLKIAEAIRERPGVSVAKVIGRADSAAALVAVSCQRCEMSKAATMMVHWPTEGDGKQADKAACNIVAATLEWKSGQPAATVRRWLDNSQRFSAFAALDAGIVDAIF